MNPFRLFLSAVTTVAASTLVIGVLAISSAQACDGSKDNAQRDEQTQTSDYRVSVKSISERSK